MNLDANGPTHSLQALHKEHLRILEAGYAAALAASGWDALVIHSGSPKKRTEYDDQYWPLRPTPHFHHWIALSEADCALVIVPGSRPKLVRPTAKDFWEKPAVLDLDFALAGFDVVDVASADDVGRALPRGPRVAIVTEVTSRAQAWGFEDAQQNPASLVRALDALRTKKSAYEVACIAEANRIAARGHDAVRRAYREGVSSELELHLLYLRATAQDDPETPYKNIVALGENAATLHHIAYEKRPRERDAQSLLVDAGATFLGYCSDITRTWTKGSGATASAFHGLVLGVEAMQRALCDEVAVGLPYEALHDECHVRLARVLREVGLVRLDEAAMVEAKITRAFLPHGLGHSLGLQCHDVGCAEIRPRADNPFLRNTATIAAGQVFTIEPGIYFIEPLLRPLREGPHASSIDWKLVDALSALGGVRIEDDLVVTTDETAVVDNLTRAHLPVGGGVA